MREALDERWRVTHTEKRRQRPTEPRLQYAPHGAYCLFHLGRPPRAPRPRRRRQPAHAADRARDRLSRPRLPAAGRRACAASGSGRPTCAATATRRRPTICHFAWEGLADDVAAVVDEIDDGSPLYAFGHSMGAAVSILAEARRPGTFRAIYAFEPIVIPPELRARAAGARSVWIEGTRKRRRDFPRSPTRSRTSRRSRRSPSFDRASRCSPISSTASIASTAAPSASRWTRRTRRACTR